MALETPITVEQAVPRIIDVGIIESRPSTDYIDDQSKKSFIVHSRNIGGAAVEGLLLGPPSVVADLWKEVDQAIVDYRSTRGEIKTKGVLKAKDVVSTSMWYASAVAYQGLDDLLTFPIYLEAQERTNTGAAYGVAAIATFGLAAFMGHRQRSVEVNKVKARGQEIIDDNSDIKPLLIDASVNSAPWQVIRQANKPREEGEPIKVVTEKNILKFAASYAIVNTGLYAGSGYMPFENDWANFGASLYLVWALQGAYVAVRDELRNPDKQPAASHREDGWQNFVNRLGIRNYKDSGVKI